MAYKQPFDVIKVDYAKIIDDLQKRRGSVTMFKKIRDAKRLLLISISGYWKSKKQSSEKPHLQLIEGSSILSAPVSGRIYSIGDEEKDLWWEDEGEGEKLWEKFAQRR